MHIILVAKTEEKYKMVSDMNYWSKVLKRILILALTIGLILICLKLSVFYMPFLVSFVLALLLEPIIRFFMKKWKWTRRLSAIFVMVVAILLIVGLLVWGVVTVFSEANNLLDSSEMYYNKAKEIIDNMTQNMNILDRIPQELRTSLETVQNNIMETVTNGITNVLTGITNWIMEIPNLLLSIFFSVMALYFLCTDKIYMIDQLEHHLPETWMKRLTKHIREIAKALGEYLRAEATLIFISFVISLIGLTIFSMTGLNIEYPLLAALGIGFIDALPILGSGTVMVPWAIISSLNGDIVLGIAIMGLWAIMSIVRQFLEPRLVGKHIGIHPAFTLIAMYTGYKLWNVTGLIIGPILLIILKNIFASILDKGVAKAIFDR